MSLHVELLGPPRATRDGVPVDGIRGAKAWALLAHLVRAERPVGRRTLADLLFPDATDPAATLRWNLSQLRRHLGVGLEGDPVVLTWPEGTQVDLDVVAHGEAIDAVRTPGLGRELLEGMTPSNDAMALWLEGERRHLAALTGDVLREAAVHLLSRGEATEATALAERAATLDPLDENGAVLLVRCLREAGRPGEARAVADAAASRLRDELGIEPSSALWSATHASIGGTVGVGGRMAVEAQLEAGEAALDAGLPDAGIDALREALGGSRAIGEPHLLARSLTALGTALIHAVRGTDQDALALLHEAIPVALAEDLPHVAARASRELGYVDMLRGRYERCERWFGHAARHAVGNDEELAWIHAFAGTGRTDVGDEAGAIGLLDEALGRAAAVGAQRPTAYAHAMRGRIRLLDDDLDRATADLDTASRMAAGLAWRSFGPWPDTMRGEVARRRGDLDGATGILERALATGRQVGDPCWESMALRGLGLVTLERGDVTGGMALLRDAPRQCRRLPDTYLWIEVYGLDALADVTSEHGLPVAGDWVHQLEEASNRHGMRRLRENAALYRSRLGEPSRHR